MKLSLTLLLTALMLTAPLAHADRDGSGRGFAAFLQVVAEAARAGRAAHDARRQGDYYAESYAENHAETFAETYADDGYYQDASHGDGYYEAAYHGKGGYADYADYGPVIHDVSGDWVFGNNVNRFQRTHQGYYVVPVGRGRGVHYVEIGDNLYQDANSSGTYEVVDEHYMVWRSNDNRNKVIELYRR